MEPEAYTEALQLHFATHANPYNAGRMRSYMLNQFDYYGIPAPLRKQLAGEFIALHGLPAPELLAETVRIAWQLPQRELQYVMMEICSRKQFMSGENRIALYIYMITTKSWWDTVDFIAANLVGPWLARHADHTMPVVDEFMQSGNMWLQRTALLFQLKYKNATDFLLLAGFIEQLAESKEFFIRKAIGWALREYSKTNPEKVVEFVSGHTISPLSRKEALRIILKHKEQ